MAIISILKTLRGCTVFKHFSSRKNKFQLISIFKNIFYFVVLVFTVYTDEFICNNAFHFSISMWCLTSNHYVVDIRQSKLFLWWKRERTQDKYVAFLIHIWISRLLTKSFLPIKLNHKSVKSIVIFLNRTFLWINHMKVIASDVQRKQGDDDNKINMRDLLLSFKWTAEWIGDSFAEFMSFFFSFQWLTISIHSYDISSMQEDLSKKISGCVWFDNNNKILPQFHHTLDRTSATKKKIECQKPANVFWPNKLVDLTPKKKLLLRSLLARHLRFENDGWN